MGSRSIMTSGQGSIAPQAMALRVHFGGEGTIGEVTVRKAGAASNLSPAFEINRRTGNDLTYVVSYGGLALGQSRSAIVAEIEIASVDGSVGITIDPQLTMLSDQGGMMKATVANSKLQVSGTTIGNGLTRPHAPGHEVN